MNKNIILSALCYSLEQTLSSMISVTMLISDDEDKAFEQATELANTITAVVKNTPNAQHVLWYDAALVERVLNARSWSDLKEVEE